MERSKPTEVVEPAPMPKPLPPKKIEEPVEKITSRISVLGDTGSSWSSVVSGTSLATTTATITSITKSTDSKLKQRLTAALVRKGKLPPPGLEEEAEEEEEKKPEKVSILRNLRIRSGRISERTISNVDSEGNTIGKPEHVDELLNQAILSVDKVLKDMVDTARRRPKNLLLGKYITKKQIFQKEKV